MDILAVEQSQSPGSAVLWSDGAVRSSRTWEKRQDLFRALPAIMEEAGAIWADVDLYAVGLGPGSFSGLRVALSAVRTLALPDAIDVFGVSSAETLAFQEQSRADGGRLAVVGDARRDRLWRVCFDCSGARPAESVPLSLVAPDALRELGPETVVVSPDLARIETVLREHLPAPDRLVDVPLAPSASSLAKLAARKRADGEPSLPLAPLYLHPAVFVEPRFGNSWCRVPE